MVGLIILNFWMIFTSQNNKLLCFSHVNFSSFQVMLYVCHSAGGRDHSGVLRSFSLQEVRSPGSQQCVQEMRDGVRAFHHRSDG